MGQLDRPQGNVVDQLNRPIWVTFLFSADQNGGAPFIKQTLTEVRLTCESVINVVQFVMYEQRRNRTHTIER